MPKGSRRRLCYTPVSCSRFSSSAALSRCLFISCFKYARASHLNLKLFWRSAKTRPDRNPAVHLTCPQQSTADLLPHHYYHHHRFHHKIVLTRLDLKVYLGVFTWKSLLVPKFLLALHPKGKHIPHLPVLLTRCSSAIASVPGAWCFHHIRSNKEKKRSHWLQS